MLSHHDAPPGLQEAQPNELDPSRLEAVQSRVDHLRATFDPSPRDDWLLCENIDAPFMSAHIDMPDAVQRTSDRRIRASLMSLSYAHRVASVSVAAYALGLPWPSPAATSTAVRWTACRATTLCFRDETLGQPDDVNALIEALFPQNLVGFANEVAQIHRQAKRLIWSNIGSSCASPLRAVEGASKERGDAKERAEIRHRAMAFMDKATWLHGNGCFEVRDDQWRWQRKACCLWYKTTGGYCEDCSLRKRRTDESIP